MPVIRPIFEKLRRYVWKQCDGVARGTAIPISQPGNVCRTTHEDLSVTQVNHIIERIMLSNWSIVRANVTIEEAIFLYKVAKHHLRQAEWQHLPARIMWMFTVNDRTHQPCAARTAGSAGF